MNADPIVGKDENVIDPEKRIQTKEISLSNDFPVLATNTPLLNQALELSQQMQTTHSAAVSLKSIFRFKWTLLTIFVLVTAPIVAAVWTQVVPDYRAYAEVRIRPIIPRLVFRT